MSISHIYITHSDAEKLRRLLNENPLELRQGNVYYMMLSAELERANVVESEVIPADVITMNSKARMRDLDTGEEMIYTLVFPEDADPSAGKISVFAPIGTAMLGYRAGDIFEWDTPDGKRKIRVEEILYQPESSDQR